MIISQKQNLLKKRAFTLIEVFFTVLVLAIFLVLSLFLFGKRISETRDATRKGDLIILQGNLDGFYMDNGYYPEPENYVQVYDVSGSALWKQGDFGDNLKQQLKILKLPKDPSGIFYNYSLINNGKKYQLKAVNDQEVKQKVGDEIYATYKTTTIIGPYNGFFVSKTGSVYFLRSVPGLFLGSGTQISIGTLNIFEDSKAINNVVGVGRMDVSDYFGQDVNKYEGVLSGMIEAFPDKIKTFKQAMNIMKTSDGGKELLTSPFSMGVAGICGASNGQVLSSAPASNLCNAGTASSVSTDSALGRYNRTCVGLSGGVDISCNAWKNTIIGDDSAGRRWPNSFFPSQCKGYLSTSSPYSNAGVITGSYWINANSGAGSSGVVSWCDMVSGGPYIWTYDTGSSTVQKTMLLLQASATNGSTTFLNDSYNSLTITPLFGVKYSSDKTKFGTTSIIFDGNSGLKIPSTTEIDFGSNSFSVDFWVNLKDADRKEMLMMYGTWTGDSSANFYLAHSGNNLAFGFSTGGIAWALEKTSSIDWNPSANVWYHILIMRNSSNTLKLYIDGKKMGNRPLDGSIFAATTGKNLMIGKDNYGKYTGLWGYMDEIRVINGAYLWDEEFSVPDRKYKIKEN